MFVILAMDIGNTNITLGGFENDEIAFVARVATNASLTSDEYAEKLLNIILLYGVECNEISGAIISSVVPPLNTVMKRAVDFAFGVVPIIVGPGIKTGINIHCDNPSSVGSDLICACVAAHCFYGSPSIIIDMGTATKIMSVNKNGAFNGVSIIPGVLMGLKSLSNGTAQLPQVDLEEPTNVIGKNTVDCMRSGVVFGNACLIDGMIERFNEELSDSPKVLATGGLSSKILKHCKHEITIDPDLVLKGLNILYKKNK